MLSAQTDEKIAKMAQSLGLYIFDISMLKENDNNILRVSITRKAPMQKLDSQSSAVSLQDCQSLSEMISPLLDVEESNLPSYFLEVSSPGLERILKTPTHYSFSLGEEVSVKCTDKSVIEGILENIDENSIEVRTQGGVKCVSFADIKKTKVTFALP